MATIGERIKQIRKDQRLTQEEFARRLCIKRAGVGAYEVGRVTPSDAVVALICREFGVREAWLRTGEGEMYRRPAPDSIEALAEEYGLNREEQVLVERFAAQPPEVRRAILRYVQDVAARLRGGAPEPETAEERAARLAADIVREEKAAERSSALPGTDTAAGA